MPFDSPSEAPNAIQALACVVGGFIPTPSVHPLSLHAAFCVFPSGKVKADYLTMLRAHGIMVPRQGGSYAVPIPYHLRRPGSVRTDVGVADLPWTGANHAAEDARLVTMQVGTWENARLGAIHAAQTPYFKRPNYRAERAAALNTHSMERA